MLTDTPQKPTTDLRSLAHAAYLEECEARSRARDELWRRRVSSATNELRRIYVSPQPPQWRISTSRRDSLEAQIDEVVILAEFERDGEPPIFYAYLWTADDGETWVPFYSLATLGKALAEHDEVTERMAQP